MNSNVLRRIYKALIEMESIDKLAHDIVRKLFRGQVNYIVVIPPTGAREKLFDLLGDYRFYAAINATEASRFAVAKIERSYFKNETVFVTELARQWNVSITDDISAGVQLRVLVEKVKKKNLSPVLLIPRFHEAMNRLGEDFGAALRDLDKGSRLSTIVDFPVNRETLKAYWDADPNKKLFLNSDWGDSHVNIFLNGYTHGEVVELAKRNYEENNKSDDSYFIKADFLFKATGGLPELVDRLVIDIAEPSFEAYKLLIEAKSTDLCSGLFRWLDAPNSLTYTRLVAQSLSTPNPMNFTIGLHNHTWRKLLLGKDGLAGCKILSWACIDRLAVDEDQKYFLAVQSSVREGRFGEVAPQLSLLSRKNYPNWEIWTAVELLCRLSEAADPFLPESWAHTVKHLKALEDLARSTKNATVCSVVNQLGEEWESLIFLLSGFMPEKQPGKYPTLEQFVCADPSDDNALIYLKFLRRKLKMARQISKPYLAQKAVVELPESLFQVFCQMKFGISIWNCSEFSEDEINQIHRQIRAPYEPPKSGHSLGFYDMLCLNLVKSGTDQKLQSLVVDADELRRLSDIHNRGRNKTVHGTAGLVESDWDEYFEHCSELIDRAKSSLLGSDISIDLIEPIDLISELFVKLNQSRKSAADFAKS